MPSLPAPPAPLLLFGLLLLPLGPEPARGAGPDPPALPIRPEKEPLPVRGAAGRWAPGAGWQGGGGERRGQGSQLRGQCAPAWRGPWGAGGWRAPTQGVSSSPASGGQRPGAGYPARAGQRPLAKTVPAGCSFGGKVYALDETWHPDLGEPFGVMRCVLCACEAVSWTRWRRPPPGPSRRGKALGWRAGGVYSELLGRRERLGGGG